VCANNVNKSRLEKSKSLPKKIKIKNYRLQGENGKNGGMSDGRFLVREQLKNPVSGCKACQD